MLAARQSVQWIRVKSQRQDRDPRFGFFYDETFRRIRTSEISNYFYAEKESKNGLDPKRIFCFGFQQSRFPGSVGPVNHEITKYPRSFRNSSESSQIESQKQVFPAHGKSLGLSNWPGISGSEKGILKHASLADAAN